MAGGERRSGAGCGRRNLLAWSQHGAAQLGRPRWWLDLRELDSLRQDLSDSKAADLVLLLAGHASYSGLVVDAGWSSKEYRVWLFETLKRQLLASQRREAQAIADLSFGSPDADEPIHEDRGAY